MQWRIPEHNKGLVLCADLAAGMAYIMLCRDLNEVPGGSHDWMMTCHGWGIFFLQASPHSRAPPSANLFLGPILIVSAAASWPALCHDSWGNERLPVAAADHASRLLRVLPFTCMWQDGVRIYAARWVSNPVMAAAELAISGVIYVRR